MKNAGSCRPDTVIDLGRPVNLTGGLVFSNLTYNVIKKKKDVNGKWVKQEADLLRNITGYAAKGCIIAVMGPSGAGKSTFLDGLAGHIVSGSFMGRVSLDGIDVNPSLIKRTSAYIMQDDRLFRMLTVYETLMFAADFRLGSISRDDKRQRVDKLIEQLAWVKTLCVMLLCMQSPRNTYIGNEGTRGVSGGERRRVSIGVDIIHGPSLLFLDEPTSGLDSTSAHSVIEKVHDIARSGSTVIFTIHQPSSRILLLLDQLIILARGQLMYQGSPKDVTNHVGRIGRKLPKGENPIEYFIDMVQEYDQSDLGVEVLAEFALTGVRPPKLVAYEEMPASMELPSPTKRPSYKQATKAPGGFDHSVRNQMDTLKSWSAGQSITYTPTRNYADHRALTKRSLTPGYYTYSSNILQGTPASQSSDYTVNEDDYLTDCISIDHPITMDTYQHLGPKFANSFFPEIWILIRRNFTNIRRTPELFLSRLFVLTAMGFMMATLFWHPKDNTQGITNRLSFFIFTVCLFFFSSNDAVPAFIQERFIFIRETSHNAYRASSYTIAGLITYLPFLALQTTVYAVIVWFPLKLEGAFEYFLLVLYISLLSTNSFVLFVSSVVPNYILGYAAVIAFTALFFLFCGYFLNSHAMPKYWKWMYYVSTMTYPYEGLLRNEYQTNKTFANTPGNIILESLGLDTNKNLKWQMIYVMLGWTVLYRVLFYIVLRFFSKNQRK